MINKHKPNRRSLFKGDTWRWAALAFVLTAVIVLAAVTSKTSAASATFTFSPSSGTYDVGSTIAVAVYEDSVAPDAVNSVQADFTYDATHLQYLSINTTGSGFTTAAPSSGGGGLVSISRGATPAVTGKQLVAKVSFKVVAASTGSSALTFGPSCNGSNGSDCIDAIEVSNSTPTNIVTGSSGASFTLKTPTPPPATPPPATPPPVSSPPPATNSPAPTSSSTTQANSYTPTTGGGSTTPATVSNDGQIKASQPITVEPATIQVDGVSKVEYFLNGKLVHTSTTAPFSFNIDTKHMLNGTYHLVTKTFYTNGKTNTSTQKIIVANPFSGEQLWLYIKHYLLLPIILIIAVIVAWIAIVRIRRAGMFGGGKSNQGSGGVGSPYNSQPAPPVVTPTNMYSSSETSEETNVPVG